jgi:gamma-glutamylcyclotransferase (GGCT)/AIG2-like uncharacterized protein YtfP
VTRLFVYGTLKRGHPNHRHLAGQTFVGEATTAPLYRLVDLGFYPAMQRLGPDGLAVKGELWDVDDAALAAIDRLEGWQPGDPTGCLYRREPIEVPGHDGVEAYLYYRRVVPGARTGSEWPFTSAAAETAAGS